MSSNQPNPTDIKKDYIQPECGLYRDDPFFNLKGNNVVCGKDDCKAKVWCHPYSLSFINKSVGKPEYQLCGLFRQDIESNEAEYLTNTGLCIACLQNKFCCLAAVHPSKDSISPPSLPSLQEDVSIIIKQELSQLINQNKEQNQVILKLMKMTLRQKLNPWVAFNSETKTEIEKNDKFQKDKILRFYKMKYRINSDRICMILGKVNPLSEVVCAHIYPSYTRGEGLELFELQDSNINDARNFLRLHKDIEEAFDKRFLSFEFLEFKNNVYLQPIIFKPQLMDQEISNENIKFSQIHERIDPKKNFRFPKKKFPYRRILSQHFRCCVEQAIDAGWIVQNEANRLNNIAFEAAQQSLDLLFNPLMNNFTLS